MLFRSCSYHTLSATLSLPYVSVENPHSAGRPTSDGLCTGRDECHDRRYGPQYCLPASRCVEFSGNVRSSFVQDRGRSLLLQTALTQDRWDKTTHHTSELGATASLTFTVERSCPLTTGPLLIARLQGALYVYYIGYGVKEMPPPALVPITLQPQHGNAIAVQSDSYRPEGAQAQITLFTSNRLDPNETYTITVTKTNATLVHEVNIDLFILTQPDRADSTPSPPGADFSLRLHQPLILLHSSNDRYWYHHSHQYWANHVSCSPRFNEHR